MKTILHKNWLCILGTVGSLLLMSVLLFTGILSSLSSQASDKLYVLKPAPENIVVLAVDDKSLQEIGRWPWNRSVYSGLITKLQGSTAIGFDISFFEQSIDDEAFTSAINNSNVPIVLASEFSFDNGKKFLKAIASKAKFGHVNLQPDKDGVVRQLTGDIDGVPSFSSAIAGLESPVIVQKNALIPFSQQPIVIPIADVISGRVAVPAGKVVLIGVTAPDFHDDHLTPVSRRAKMPGVLIHAQSIKAMQSGEYLSKQALGSIAFWMVLLSGISALMFWRFRLSIASLATLALAGSYVWYGKYLFTAGVVADLLHPVATAALTGIACTAGLYSAEKKHRAWISNVFGKYVSKEVAGEIMKAMHTGGEIKLGGEKRAITVLFSDIRGFTTLSEGMKPEELVALLNEYLTAMTSIIIKHKGVVDKYIGDAIMAFWNAPIEQKDHAYLAVSSAKEMVEELSKLQESWKKRSLPQLKIGVGINTGEAVVGNMGSRERLSYTAMGDTVNLASRLEGLTKEYGVSITISDTAYEIVKEKIACRKLDIVQVKGKKKPVAVYEPSDDKNTAQAYEKALELYRAGKFSEAGRIFSKLQDNASKVMSQRCRDYARKKPSNWSGVQVMTHK